MPYEDAYESMFGRKALREVDYFMPPMLPMNLNENLIKEVMETAKREKKWVLAFVIGTKPCFYKFWGSMRACDKLGIPNFVIDSNQHYDEILTHGLKEFNYQDKIAVNLSIRGDLAQKSAELMIKVSWIARYLSKHWPDVTVVPVVLGDTIMTSIVPASWMFARNEKAIQNEAGLRSMAPEVMKEVTNVTTEEFIERQFNGKWMLLRNEPFPEQWDTYTSAAGSEFLFVPIELNRQHLLREGYPSDNIFVIGGVVVDALNLKKSEKPKNSIFELYPQLERGEWVRMDIHRRDNLTERRFKAIIGSVRDLVKKGYQINFVEMNATKYGIEKYKLREVIDGLKKFKNFLHTDVWPEYSHVIEFYESENCFAAMTDSGGLQEETNLLKKPCLTCRFNTDRPETVNISKNNLLLPPISSDFIVKTFEYIHKNEALRGKMSSAQNLYGENVGDKFAKTVLRLIENNERPFKWAHEALGLWREGDNGGGML